MLNPQRLGANVQNAITRVLDARNVHPVAN
jgi:hypothetical protein